MAKFRERIKELLKQGVEPQNICECLGCAMSTVYRYTPRHPKKYNEAGKRWCWKCKKYKPVNEFCKDKSAKDGLQYQCRECNKEAAQLRRDRIKNGVAKKTKRVIIKKNQQQPKRGTSI